MYGFFFLAAAVDCAALYLAGVNVSGIYVLQPDPTDNRTRFPAFCDMETDGGGWTVIQVRSYLTLSKYSKTCKKTTKKRTLL